MAKWMTLLGGVHSGKTELATEVCEPFEKVVWWGTASEQPQDLHWQKRLQSLRESRNPQWTTLDGPWAWPQEKPMLPAKQSDCDIFVMDCLNLWLAAHIHRGTSRYSMSQLKVHLEMEFSQLLSALNVLKGSVVIVSAEVGWGVVPSGEAGRLFRDLLTDWNRQIVKHSDYGVSVQAGRAFVWPGGRTSLPSEGVEVRCVEAHTLSRLLTAV